MPALRPRRLLVAAVALLVTAATAACGATTAAPPSASATTSATASASSTGSGGSSATPTPSSTPGRYAGLAPASPVSGLRTMTVAQLPKEGVTTLTLIAADGPYPYSKDGTTFSNREGILPRHPSGWYREFTVVTPGSRDRGARRIIAGDDGGRFYTSDHYDSFREVLSGETS